VRRHRHLVTWAGKATLYTRRRSAVNAFARGSSAIRLAGASRSSQIGDVTSDPHAPLRDRALESVLDGPGESDPLLRHAAADCKGLPAGLQAFVSRIHEHAYKVTDEEVARLQATYGDDRMFEIVVSAAIGASHRRLVVGLSALEQA
jgi:hypothetical protein